MGDGRQILFIYLENEITWGQKFNKALKDARVSFRRYLKASGHNSEQLTEKDIERTLDELQGSS